MGHCPRSSVAQCCFNHETSQNFFLVSGERVHSPRFSVAQCCYDHEMNLKFFFSWGRGGGFQGVHHLRSNVTLMMKRTKKKFLEGRRCVVGYIAQVQCHSDPKSNFSFLGGGGEGVHCLATSGYFCKSARFTPDRLHKHRCR